MDDMRYQLDLLKVKNQKLESDGRMYRSLINTSTSAFLYLSFADNHFERMGDWKHFFDFDVNSVKEFDLILDSAPEQDRNTLRDVLFLEKTGRSSATAEFSQCGKRRFTECEVTVTYDEKNTPAEKIIRFKDITKFKVQNDELSYLAYYDSITGLYNRNYFVRLLAEWLRKAKEDNSNVSVMFFDIDDFRKINDGLGIVVGDELVQVFGQFLGSFTEDKVIVSHFNADIYCLAIYDPCGARSVENIYHAIREHLQKPLLLSNRMELKITVSAGVAEFPEASDSALELINAAEIVMFKAKASGKDSISFFDAVVLQEFKKNIEIENKLKDALFSNRFVLYYQPQFNVETGALRGVEALIRWKDIDGVMISPSEFIPVAERNGSIVSIGNWVIEEALRSLSQLRRRFRIDFIMSINISAIQFKRHEFVGDVIAMINKLEIDPKFVEFEITESILIDDFNEIIRKMVALRDYGMKVSLDDFGTGYSSLSYLKGLPIDTLKIDKSFIDTVTVDEPTRVITTSIIEMVKELGFETVAEGVETKDQYDYLKSIDCDNIQGYLLSKPLDYDSLEKVFISMM